jgi:hypothetical protein
MGFQFQSEVLEDLRFALSLRLKKRSDQAFEPRTHCTIEFDLKMDRKDEAHIGNVEE